MTADLSRLRAVLERELEAGATDALVQGGLDALLRREAADEPTGSALRRMIGALAPDGYAALDDDQRTTWLRRALATIRRETVLEDALRPAAPGPPAGEPPGGEPVRSRPPSATRATRRPATPRATKPQARAPSTTGARAVRTTPTANAARRAPPGAAALDLPIGQAGTLLHGATLERLERLGIRTVGDALRHYPARHHDFSRTVAISALRPGVEQTVRGTVDRSREVRMGRGGRMRATEVQLSDDLGARITAIWFNQPYLAKQLPAGAQVALAGRVTIFRRHAVFQNPEYERLDGPAGAAQHTGRFVPVYPLTAGLAQRTLRTAIAGLLDAFGGRVEDPLPPAIRARHGLLPLAEATRQVHYPDSEEALHAARRRLAFDELLAIQVGVQTRKREWQAQGDAPAVTDHAAADAFLALLPFTLTAAQRDALADVRRDLARTVPMSRLLEGDVGSGKTVVAVAAMLSMVSAGYQAVMMAPTEVLAEQHFRTLCRLLAGPAGYPGVPEGSAEPPLHGVVHVPGLPLPVKVVLLTGSTKAKERREAVQALRFGGAQIAVGTHALIQEGVDYARLGLAVVDEQHRFGVMQRGALRHKGTEGADARGHEGSGAGDERSAIQPHLLVMSATPIPRSLALTLYGDLDLSIIGELPLGRTPIATRWLAPVQRAEAFAHVRREIAAGRQAFVICPLVEGSESVESRAATAEYERLTTEQFPDLGERGRIALLHGRMGARAKEAVMRAFAAGEADILVSTAVVEVGIDVPNATVMVIEGADRFGLAQLHQFRGRVGRGDHPSACYLLADDPTPEAEERLSILERTTDGFALAQADLELRGPGDLFGTAQSGLPSLRVASLLDAPLIDAARREAETLLDDDPDLRKVEHHALKRAIAERVASVVSETH
ncbi:MAG: ATP-dependent DNA helicase RecG [Dehalococcoidia bacterium]|nr:ATP-dependent DNA helicase RecG [Dehalococcoidia bacterium]